MPKFIVEVEKLIKESLDDVYGCCPLDKVSVEAMSYGKNITTQRLRKPLKRARYFDGYRLFGVKVTKIQE